jgi:hypothetical protein
MRRMLYGVLLLSACHRDITAPTTALLVTASVSRASFRAGDTVTVLVTVFNRSGQPQTIEGDGCGFLFFEVTTPDGSVVGPNGRLCSMILIPKTLVPGEQYSSTQSWNGTAFGNGPGASLPMLTPGTYFVVGQAFPIGSDGSSEPLPAIDHVPAVIAITR